MLPRVGFTWQGLRCWQNLKWATCYDTLEPGIRVDCTPPSCHDAATNHRAGVSLNGSKSSHHCNLVHDHH